MTTTAGTLEASGTSPPPSPPRRPPHVLILGGGFGGLSAATEIRKTLSPAQAKITVVDKKDWFMVGFAKLWILNGTRTFEDSTGSLGALEKKGIGFVKDEVTSIDLESRTVQTPKQSIPYDYLLVSMGAVLVPGKIPGLAENGYNLYDHDQLLEMRDRLRGIKSGRIAIAITAMPYKCPPAPFEACMLIDSMLRKTGRRDSVEIHIYSPAPVTLPAAGPEVSAQILDMVSSGQITFHGSCKIRSVEPGRMVFEGAPPGDGPARETDASFDLLLAVPPHAAPPVVYACNLAREPGFIPIDRDCKTAFNNVYAAGDITTLSVREAPPAAVPKAGVFAEGEGVTVAKDIVSRILSGDGDDGRDRPPEAALFDGKGGCFIESGRETASVIEVDMFADKGPAARLTESTAGNLAKKHEFERERLDRWLG